MWRRWLLALLVADVASVRAQEATLAQIAWIRKNAVVFDTVNAGHGFQDLQPLRQLVGDARIVSLGEPTHGPREIFQMKHRLLEFLVEELGFSIFSIEANMPEAFRLNDYVLRGRGNPDELAQGGSRLCRVGLARRDPAVPRDRGVGDSRSFAVPPARQGPKSFGLRRPPGCRRLRLRRIPK